MTMEARIAQLRAEELAAGAHLPMCPTCQATPRVGKSCSGEICWITCPTCEAVECGDEDEWRSHCAMPQVAS